jgi:hypothetical protein
MLEIPPLQRITVVKYARRETIEFPGLPPAISQNAALTNRQKCLIVHKQQINLVWFGGVDAKH